MEIVGLLTDNLGALAFAILGMGGILSFCYAGWLYQTSFGDQQQQAKARNAFWGGCLGLLIGGFSFAIPEILSSEVIGRSGGDPIVVRASSECDQVLQNRLAHEVQANTPERMRQIVRFVQAENDGCGRDLWDPVIGEDAGGTNHNSYADYRASCFGSRTNNYEVASLYTPNPPRTAIDGFFAVGGVQVPASLSYQAASGYPGTPRGISSRDIRNNIIVYFGQLQDRNGNVKIDMSRADDKLSSSVGYPTSGEKCWLFIARENLWVGN